MITTRNHELSRWQLWGEKLKGLNHKFKTLVSPPFSEGEDLVFRSSAPGKIRKFWTARQQAVSPQMHIVAPVLIVQDLPISRH
jgi:hypothetical protein